MIGIGQKGRKGEMGGEGNGKIRERREEGMTPTKSGNKLTRMWCHIAGENSCL